MKTKQLLIALIIALSLTLVLSTTVFADDIIVNTTDDQNGTGSECSLREAIQAANTNASFGGCTAGSGHDTLIITPTGTITLTGQLEITSSLTISGPGAGSLSISGNGASRVITTSSGITVTITGVTIRDGSATDGGGIYNNSILTLTNSAIVTNTAALGGGGIYNSIVGTLVVDHATISFNTASGTAAITTTGGGGLMSLGMLTVNDSTVSSNHAESRGGGIRSDGTLLVSGSMINDNTADAHGGGIYNLNGPADITDSTIADNVADYDSGNTGDGGGIAHNASGIVTVMMIRNSTISGNTAVDGGGIRNLGVGEGFTATMTISNSTISGNDAGRNGGGVINTRALTGSAVLNIANSTIAANTATGTDGDGGGVYRDWSTDVYVRNTIIAGNADAGDDYPDIWGNSINSLGYSLVGNRGGATFGGGTDLVGEPASLIDPLLASLADNGGDTWTHALLPGSPAVNAGDCTGAPSADQRGVTRPQGAACDIGAYEAQPELDLNKTADDDTPNPGQRITFTISVGNNGALTTTTALISDTLPVSLTFAGPVILSPAQPGAILATSAVSMPTVASGVTITPGERVTVTFPVTVNVNLTGGTVLTNTAAVTSTEVNVPQTGRAMMTVNSTPVANDVPVSTDENTPVNGTLNASDPDAGDTLIYGISIDPISGTVTITDTVTGDFIYTPTANLNGTDLFTYIVTDTGNLTATAKVTVTINPVNDAPENSMPVPQGTNEDTPLEFSSTNGNLISIGDVDAGDNPVQVALTVTHGLLTLNGTTGLIFSTGDGDDDVTMVFTGTIASINTALNGMVFSPTTGYTGTASLQIRTDDQGYSGSGGAKSDTDTVNITINSINDSPVNTVPGAQNTNEDIPLVFSSANSNAVSISDLDAGSNPLQVALTVTHGSLTLNGTAGLTFSTGGGADDIAMVFTGTIGNINTALDGMTLTLEADYSGSASFQINTNDLGHNGTGGPQSDTDTVNITINPVNDAPTLDSIDDMGIDEDAGLQTVSLSGIGTGATDENQTLTVTVTSANPALIANPITVTYTSPNAAGSLSFKPEADQFGIATIVVTVTDGISDTPQSFTVTVNSVNDAPTLDSINDTEIDEDAGLQTVSLSGIGTGANENQTLTVTATSANPVLIANPITVTYTSPSATGSLSFKPEADQSGTATIVVTVTDGISDTAESFVVTVNAPALSVIKTVEGTGGSTTTLSLGSIVTYTIVLTNSGDGTATGVVMTDPLPSAVIFGGWLDQGSAHLPPPSEDTIVWGQWDIPAHTPYATSFTATITTDTAFLGDTIVNTAYFTSTNAAPGSDSASFTIAGNIAPVAVNDTYDVNEGGTLNVSAPGVLGNDTDPDSATLTATLVSGPSYAASFILNGDGAFDYTHDDGETLGDSFTYTVTDGLSTSNLATVTLVITPVNDSPVLDPIGNQMVQVSTTLTFTASATDVDIPANTLTYTLDAGAPAGASIAPSTGDFTWTPTVTGIYTVTVRVSDGVLDDSEIVSITVTTEPVYTLIVNTDGSGSGSVIKDPDSSAYLAGTVVALTAVSAPGSEFTIWSGALGAVNPVTITINADTTVTATFTLIEYILTVNTVGNGAVSQDPDQATYHYSDVVTLTAEPAQGWELESWSGGGLSGNNLTATITMDDDYTITATFTTTAVVAGVTVTPTTGLTTTEGGMTATFTVVLDSEPTADVTIGLSSSNEDEGIVSTTVLTFTTGNWNMPQTVIVTGVDDDIVDGDVVYTIQTAAAVSGDSNYNGLDPADVSVTNLDDDFVIYLPLVTRNH